ncbi:hypothetical protein HDU98_011610 [Podochytrium sp. JEL0797]|nr:hypothetical protein HDU98_011610 [Podochytrium sp. JEL0797]
MLSSIAIIACLITVVFSTATVYHNQISQRKTLAYFTDYSIPSVLHNANLAHMDVLLYAHIHVDSNGGCSFGKANMANLNFALAQRATFPHLKVTLSIGGAARVFSAATSTAANRAAFVQNCVALVDQVKADGLDIDWENPGTSDASNLLALVQLFRSALGTTRILSIATPTDIYSLQSANLPSLAPYLDWYGVMSYSYNHMGLTTKPASTTDVDDIVRTFLSAGIQPSQLVVAIAFYGYTCKLPSNGDKTNLKNCVVKSNNQVLAKGVTGTSVFDHATFAEYTFQPNGGVLVYNTRLSARMKAQYVVDTALYGIMIWEFSQDSTLGMYNTIVSTFQSAPVASVEITIPGNTASGACNGTVLNPQCGGAAFNWGACSMSQCCSQYNYCTSDPKWCSAPAKPVCPISPPVLISQTVLR